MRNPAMKGGERVQVTEIDDDDDEMLRKNLLVSCDLCGVCAVWLLSVSLPSYPPVHPDVYLSVSLSQ